MASEGSSTSLGSGAAIPDPRSQKMRRPTTTDETAFWHISEEHWNELLRESSTDSKKALNNLRKFDQAGRMMETAEGTVAAVPCRVCEGRPSNHYKCMVFADGSSRRCAFCIRHAKAGCKAKAPLGQSLAESSKCEREDRFAEIEARVAKMEAQIAGEGAQLAQMVRGMDSFSERVARLASDYLDVAADVKGIFEAVMPGQQPLSSLHIEKMTQLASLSVYAGREQENGEQ